MTYGIPRPCISCGELVEPPASRCRECRPKDTRGRRRSARWDKLSKSVRAKSSSCEVPGCSSTDLTVDHIVPISEDPKLEYEPLNCRVLCRHHNSVRKDACTEAERAQVYSAIAARKARTARYYAQQQ